MDEIMTISREAHTVEKRITDNFDTDTIDFEFAKKMEAFKGVLNSFAPLQEMFLRLTNDSKTEKLALIKLKNDIENGNGDRAKYAEFVSFEQAKVKQICSLLAEYSELKKETVATFQKLHTEINDYSLTFLPR